MKKLIYTEENFITPEECQELIAKRKITLKDLERFKLNVSSYYGVEGTAGVVETYIVDTLEELVRGDYD